MIRAKLIIGGHPQARRKFAFQLIRKHLGTRGHPDLLVIDQTPSVTINQVREIKKRLALKPYSASIKIIFLAQAERLTSPAQNALLKTIEEPPGEALLLLSAPRKESLLPTIVSRCQLIRLGEQPNIKIDRSTLEKQLAIINSILKSRVGERLTIAQNSIQNRQEAVRFCQEQLLTLRAILRGEASLSFKFSPHQLVHLLREVQKSLVFLEANINFRLVIENLLFAYPQASS